MLTTSSTITTPDGWVAEWSCSGLQSRGRRFDSALSLHYYKGEANSSEIVITTTVITKI